MGENPRPLEPRCLPNSTLVFKYLSSEIDNKIKVHTTNTAPDPCPNTAPVSKHCTRVQTLHPCPNIAPMSEHQHVANTSTHLGLGAGAPLFSEHTWKGVGGWVEGGGCVSVRSAWVCLTTCRVWGERRRRAKWGLGGEGVEIASCRAQS